MFPRTLSEISKNGIRVYSSGSQSVVLPQPDIAFNGCIIPEEVIALITKFRSSISKIVIDFNIESQIIIVIDDETYLTYPLYKVKYDTPITFLIKYDTLMLTGKTNVLIELGDVIKASNNCNGVISTKTTNIVNTTYTKYQPGNKLFYVEMDSCETSTFTIDVDTSIIIHDGNMDQLAPVHSNISKTYGVYELGHRNLIKKILHDDHAKINVYDEYYTLSFGQFTMYGGYTTVDEVAESVYPD